MDAFVAIHSLRYMEVTLEAAQHVGVGGGKTGLGRDQADHVAQRLFRRVVEVGVEAVGDPVRRGLGEWTDAQVIAALQTGVRPDGRMLAPIMPWRAFAGLTKADATAIVAYLRSLPPVSNKVPGPFGPSEMPTSFVMKIVPPGAK